MDRERCGGRCEEREAEGRFVKRGRREGRCGRAAPKLHLARSAVLSTFRSACCRRRWQQVRGSPSEGTRRAIPWSRRPIGRSRGRSRANRRESEASPNDRLLRVSDDCEQSEGTRKACTCARERAITACISAARASAAVARSSAAPRAASPAATRASTSLSARADDSAASVASLCDWASATSSLARAASAASVARRSCDGYGHAAAGGGQ